MGLLIILGAGASYDSVDLGLAPALGASVANRSVWSPPLTSDLFSERPAHIDALNRFPQMSHLVPELRRSASESGMALEKTLRELQEQERSASIRQGLLAVRYYLRDICGKPINDWRKAAGGATNHTVLLRQAVDWAGSHETQITFLTFNYDTLLEAAAGAVLSRSFSELDDYISGPNVSILKPHGSVDWIEYVDLPAGYLPTDPISAAASLTFTGEYDHESSYPAMTTGRPRVPALAIPVDATKSFVSPENHLERMRESIADADRVLMVGWRGSEKHFLKELRSMHPSSVGIVDADQDGVRAVRNNFSKARVSHGTRQMGFTGGFSGFLAVDGFRRWADGDLVGDQDEHGNL